MDLKNLTDSEIKEGVSCLCRALLARVRQDIAGGGSPKDRDGAIDWVEGRCPRALITFADACQIVGWDPDKTRRHLLRPLPLAS
ncbi:hypothetical protein [Thermithiobacillus plumbiphilus]|uniref:Uncharacterized protein n=1 Tax=Thermithiobacillus plumbiphilus TaxID=1729899 RepID=A0ABU9D6X2_9PROT